jgi:hypothetical protein
VIIAPYSFFFIPYSEPVLAFLSPEPKGSTSLVLTAAPSPALAVPITDLQVSSSQELPRTITGF